MINQNKLKRIHCIVSGEVQGVGFRAFTKRQAEKLSLVGWVRNCNDGTVEIIAEGSTDKISTFMEQIRRGPPCAQVSEVKILESEELHQLNFRSFSINF